MELIAIHNDLCISQRLTTNSIPINSNNLSSLYYVNDFRIYRPQIHEIKIQLRNLLQKMSLEHVAALKGLLANITAGMLIKEATAKIPIDSSLPAPHSYVKIFLKTCLLQQCQDH